MRQGAVPLNQFARRSTPLRWFMTVHDATTSDVQEYHGTRTPENSPFHPPDRQRAVIAVPVFPVAAVIGSGRGGCSG
jgi:hypothetical protein